MEKNYNHQDTEERIYEMWEDGHYFTPQIDHKKKPYTIILPLPNASDPMHLGHALFTVEDILVRYHRMLGEPTLWLPGGDHAGRLLSIPMEVLVNGGSASAAEIFAGAIKDNNRGKLIGEKTFGKGRVQDGVPFPGGSSLHVTFAKWLTPKGTSIHNVGITPDVIIEVKDTASGQDPQLDRALELF